MQNNANKPKVELVYSDLSYQILGSAFRVHNELGWGFSEKHHQLALANEFESSKIPFKREVYISINYQTIKIGKYFADFVIDDRILLEVKVVRKLGYAHTRQLLGYLKSAGLRLGIILYFSPDGVKYRRVLNSSV